MQPAPRPGQPGLIRHPVGPPWFTRDAHAASLLPAGGACRGPAARGTTTPGRRATAPATASSTTAGQPSCGSRVPPGEPELPGLECGSSQLARVPRTLGYGRENVDVQLVLSGVGALVVTGLIADGLNRSMEIGQLHAASAPSFLHLQDGLKVDPDKPPPTGVSSLRSAGHAKTHSRETPQRIAHSFT